MLEDICIELEKMMNTGIEIKEIKKYLYNQEINICIETKDKIWESLMKKYNCLENAFENLIRKKEILEFQQSEFNSYYNSTFKLFNITNNKLTEEV